MTRKPNSALRSLRYASGEASAFINGVAHTSERLAERSGEALVGTFGGVLGAGAGMAVPAIVHVMLLPFLTVPLGGAFGIVTAMLLWRGPTRMLRERKQRELESELARRQAFSAKQLKELGPHGDPELLAFYKHYPMAYLRERGAASPTPLALPAPTQEPMRLFTTPTNETGQVNSASVKRTSRKGARSIVEGGPDGLPEGLEP